MHDFTTDARFSGIIPFENKIWLSSPTMHGQEQEYIKEAFDTNWITTAGSNIKELERLVAEKAGVKHVVALTCGTAALHLSIKLAAQKLYGASSGVCTPDGLGQGGSLYGRRVFCSDMTFSATVNPVVYEGGEPVFIDTESDTWNMDPKALARAFSMYPDVKLVVLAHLYGTPGKIDEIREICKKHHALLIEDAAESFGASYKNQQTGSFGDYGIVSFNGNKIITGSSGGCFLTNRQEDADRVRKWSTQSREAAPWYQHEELGYNYRISNIVAGIARGQMAYLEEHIKKKKEIYERYKEGFRDIPVSMNPMDLENSVPNYWLSCLLINSEALCETVRSEKEALWIPEKGKSCPTEILHALNAFHAEGRPIWKPMHMQPMYQNHAFVTAKGSGRGQSNAYADMGEVPDVGNDIFQRGLCLPSDIKMTEKEQNQVIKIVKSCFC